MHPNSVPGSLLLLLLFKLCFVGWSSSNNSLVHVGQSFLSLLELFGEISLPLLFLLRQHTSHPVLLLVLVLVELLVWKRGQKVLNAKFAGHLEQVSRSSQGVLRPVPSASFGILVRQEWVHLRIGDCGRLLRILGERSWGIFDEEVV